jgi:hypothetical protein
MKTLMTILSVLALSLLLMAQSQDTTQQNNGQGQASQSNPTNAEKTKSMSGKVSADGKNFKNDKDKVNYKVDNPTALEGHEDQHVALVVEVDPDNNVIHVTQVELPQP